MNQSPLISMFVAQPTRVLSGKSSAKYDPQNNPLRYNYQQPMDILPFEKQQTAAAELKIESYLSGWLLGRDVTRLLKAR